MSERVIVRGKFLPAITKNRLFMIARLIKEKKRFVPESLGVRLKYYADFADELLNNDGEALINVLNMVEEKKSSSDGGLNTDE